MIKVQELINRLEELKKELGNVEVELYMEDIDGTKCGVNTINEVDISTDPDGNKAIYIAHIVDNEKYEWEEYLDE